jgi:hypothetical protein
MSFDIYDYILSKVHDSLEDPTTTTSTGKKEKKNTEEELQ